MNYLYFLGLTLLVEIPIIFIVIRGRARVRYTLTATLFGNLVSHPLVHMVPPTIFPSREWFLVSVEAGAVAIEAMALLWLARPNPRRLAVVSSLAANLASFLAGIWISGM
jgi:hypothetical protein